MDQSVVYRAETDEARAILERISENADNAAVEDRLNGFTARARVNEAFARAMRLIVETKCGITVNGLRRQLMTEFRLRPAELNAVMDGIHTRTKGVVGRHKAVLHKSRR